VEVIYSGLDVCGIDTLWSCSQTSGTRGIHRQPAVALARKLSTMTLEAVSAKELYAYWRTSAGDINGLHRRQDVAVTGARQRRSGQRAHISSDFRIITLSQ